MNVKKPQDRQEQRTLTAVRHHESRQAGKRLIGGDEKAAVVERLNLVMFHMMTPTLLPVLHRQTVTPGIVLAGSHQEGTARILVDQEQRARLLARYILEEPTAKKEREKENVIIGMTRLSGTTGIGGTGDAHSSLSIERSTATKFQGIRPSCRVVKCSTLHQSGSESSNTSIRSPFMKLTSVLSRAV